MNFAFCTVNLAFLYKERLSYSPGSSPAKDFFLLFFFLLLYLTSIAVTYYYPATCVRLGST
ncbi:uncharacterized protein BDZ99DRAFT_18621 [Mytilinidion resinicola]|uniref:Uncharacterized protein n=1 Tax=Mytilinidion resinicola TaxID=574789 RepID=A0A6A6ZB80_9PEZI|nr:uncharacterized protein BDZ99DRAFT_18621 [Mytilinidion resinicola]KAF2817564.1 hypothetical protein BDZ99DRAFT_18621 [Mytilinidion resinicola]